MADNDKNTPAELNKQSKSINKSIDRLDSRLDDIYKNTYATDPSTRDQAGNIADDIFKSINTILSTNSSIQGLPDITQLYTRIEQKNNTSGTTKVVKDLMDVLGNDELVNVIVADPEINRYIRAKDLQIDMVLKYMPKLEEALAIKQDNVLSADNFNKSFLNVTNKSLSEDDQKTFSSRTEHLIRKYRLEEKLETVYENTAKYGEQFIYIVPYDKALKRLQQVKGTRRVADFPAATFESASIIENHNIVDKSDNISSFIGLSESLRDFPNVKIKYNTTNTLTEVVDGYKRALKVYEKQEGKSFYEIFTQEISNINNDSLNESPENAIKKMSDTGKPIDHDKIAPANKKRLDKIMPDDLEYDKLYNTANDGLVAAEKVINGDKINPIPGALFKLLKHENVIPIYIEDICLGYYYIEFDYYVNEDIDRSKVLLSNTFETIHKEDIRDDHDVVIRYIASKISQNIDDKFINANQDLKEEIYAVLKYNSRFNSNYENNTINVTYLPPQDLYHFYFKLDPDTHRGISDLDKALIPGMFWVLLDLITTMGIVTRSQDHRVYWIKQNVEQNIAKTLMNVVNQLKKGNMGIRQMQSMNSILNIIGRYNDYVIPVGPSGDAPISFDTIQGQQIDTPTDLMNKYEDQAINSTDVPLELVNSTNQVDYATRYVMQNSKFLRKVLKRQAIVEDKFTTIFSRIYNYEYDENEKAIAVKLPTPVFLSSVNGLALINNVKEYVNAIASIQYQEGTEFDEKERAVFVNLLLRQQLGTYIDLNNIDELVGEAKVICATPQDPTIENREGGAEDEGL